MKLEIYGSITKEEEVKSLNIGLPNTMVLEDLGLFYGYYGARVTNEEMPDSIFLALNSKESAEKIFRLTHYVKKRSEIPFEGVPATVCVQNNTYTAIRIRNIESFDQIATIQDFYRDFGIEFAKAKDIKEYAIIKVTKVSNLCQITDGVWKDEERNIFYLETEHHIPWSLFKKITKHVRNNIDLTGFDAALAVMYRAEVNDFIRIYTKKLSTEQLVALREKYESIIDKYI